MAYIGAGGGWGTSTQGAADRRADRADERAAVAHRLDRLGEALRQHARHAAQALDHLEVRALEAVEERLRVVDLPPAGGGVGGWWEGVTPL